MALPDNFSFRHKVTKKIYSVEKLDGKYLLRLNLIPEATYSVEAA